MRVCLEIPENLPVNRDYTASTNFRLKTNDVFYLDSTAITPFGLSHFSSQDGWSMNTWEFRKKVEQSTPVWPALVVLGLVVAWTAWDFFRKKGT